MTSAIRSSSPTAPLEGVERPRLALALLLSLMLHAAVGVYWVSGGFSDRLRQSAIKYPEKRDSPIRLGIERSSAQNLTWLGFETPTPHAADVSVVEQAALAPKVGESADSQSESEARKATEASAFQIVDPEAVRSAVRDTSESVSRMFQIGREALTRAMAAAAEEQAEAARRAAEAEESKVAGEPANPSESESMAVSIEETIEVSPGKPAAVEGLEIITVRPRWNIGTRLTASPRNPMVRIVFIRDGSVLEANFTQGGSGFSSVDEPLLDAIYSWRAKGKRLEELSTREGATLSITMRILLR